MGRRIASRAGSWLVFACALALFPRVVRAQSESAATRAQTLFDEARALMKQGEYQTACSKLAQSQELDPGGGTLLNLGICHEKQGRTATAFAELSQALAQAKSEKRVDRERTAQRHLDALGPELSHVTLLMPSGIGAPGLVVEIDGLAIDSIELGSPIAVDPGAHEIRVSRPGHTPLVVEVSVGEREQQNVELAALEPEPASPPPPLVSPEMPDLPAPTALRAPAVKTPAPLRTPEAPDHTARWVGGAALGVGAVAVAVGSYFGVRTFTLKSESNANFDGKHCLAQSCVDDWSKARTAAEYSTAAFGIGLAAIGIGTYLVLSPPKHQRASRETELRIAGSPSGFTLSARTNF